MRIQTAAVATVVTAAMVFGGVTASAAGGGAAVDNTVVIYDAYGQRLDAHDGDLLQTADGTIYLYGTAYGCGFHMGSPGPYCGVRVYTTRDLRTWTPAGALGGQYAFNHLDGDWQAACTAPNFGCYRPHVVPRSDGKYVMWLNTHGEAGYRTLVADDPAGPFEPTGVVPDLAVKPPSGWLSYGDEDVTIAPDGRGYITYTAIDPADNAHTLVIEELDPTLTIGTGRHVVIDAMPGVPDLVEAPALFYGPNDAWYLVYSDPAKAYWPTDSGIVNGPRNTPDPIGDYGWPRALVGTSCAGQPTGVWPITGANGATWVYGADRWEPGKGNQARSNNYYGALTFDAAGGTAIDAYSCQAFWTLR